MFQVFVKKFKALLNILDPKKKIFKKPNFKGLEGCLRKHKRKYTSLELQKKSLDWF